MKTKYVYFADQLLKGIEVQVRIELECICVELFKSISGPTAGCLILAVSCPCISLFQRHVALLVTNNALCLMSGLVSGI